MIRRGLVLCFPKRFFFPRGGLRVMAIPSSFCHIVKLQHLRESFYRYAHHLFILCFLCILVGFIIAGCLT